MDVRGIVERLGIRVERIANGNLLAHCPLGISHTRADKHPSLSIHAEDGRWICFAGCGQGSLLDLVSALSDTELDESVYLVIQESMLNRLYDNILGGKQTEKEKLNIDMSRFNFKKMYQYLLDRGFTKKTIKQWHLGIDEDIPAVIIPVNFRGELVGYIRRNLFTEPRYWNYPSMPKSEILFGIDQFQSVDGWVNICEGPLDCIWLHQNGFPNSVAALGAKTSEEQISLLKGLGNGIRICYDNDKAGRLETKRLYKLLRGKIALNRIRFPYNVKDVQELDPEQLKTILN